MPFIVLTSSLATLQYMNQCIEEVKTNYIKVIPDNKGGKKTSSSPCQFWLVYGYLADKLSETYIVSSALLLVMVKRPRPRLASTPS